MKRLYIIEALSAMLEDIFRHPITFPYREEFDAFFEPEEFDRFRQMMQQEFDLDDNTIVDSAATFNELVALLVDELFF